MRIDKLTTKFQEALGDAQTLALGGDHAYIEPSHVLVAMLRQDDGPKSLLQRAGANVLGLLSSAEDAMNRLPKVEGQEQVQVGRDTVSLIQLKKKPSSAATSLWLVNCSCSPCATTKATGASSLLKMA
jgi:ATP-dependent Clp protease ATP-binding subunit ClpB